MSPSEQAAAAARLAGDWQLAVERGGGSLEGWLHFSESAGELVGSLTGPDNNPRELSKITQKEDKIFFEVASDYATERYEGRVKGSSMEGTLKMSRSGGGRAGRGGSGEDSGGARGGRGGYGGRGGSRGGGGGGGENKWKAFRSVQPIPGPAPEPPKAPGV
ncbi:MAG TPA: hypothetical protein VER78_04795 [Thermoanaerobaculia bacterium]|nr:hypothetical protein [Thermoanaerobaculia bacterium]